MCCRRSRRARCCRRATSRRSRPISRTSTRGPASIGVQRQLGPRTSHSVDANINRGIKHGFLDMNQAAPIPKDVLNAALASNPNATHPHAGAGRCDAADHAGPNGFRSMDLLTNEGRSWYQGVRIAAQHRTAPLVLTVSYTRSKSEDRLNHWFSPENSADPELDRGPTGADTPQQPRRQRDVESFQAAAPVSSGWRLSAVSHTSERQALYDSLRGRPDRRWIDRRLQLAGLPVEPARRVATRRAATSSTMRT